MNTGKPYSGPVRFGVFEVDLRTGGLRKHGIKIKLQEQPLQILQQLLEHPGEVVTREELQKRIWPVDTFVDFDHGLYSAVQRLRDSLGDNAETPRYVETLPRRGYRFLAAVDNGNRVEAKVETASAEAPVSVVPEGPAPRRSLRIPLLVAAGVAVVVLLFVLEFMGGSLRERLLGKATLPPIRSLAVLPLQNLSNDPSQEYFADGMTDALITDLAQIGSLKVISRTSTMRYKKSDKTLPEIARELNVGGIVEGTIQRSGDRVRITAQLIHAPTDKHVWASSFERDARDVLTVEGEVAQAIAVEIRARLTPQEQARLTQPRPVNLKAHEAYLRGWHEDDIGGTLSNRQGMQQAAEEHLRRAVEYYEQAIREDPGFAPAYLGLAYNGSSDRAETAARKALEIDDSLSEAHLILGAIKLVRDLDWRDAEKELLRAIELNLNNAAAHQGYAYFLDAAGRLEEGMREYERAQELDPENDHLAPALYSRRQFDRLIELERNAIARDPASTSAASAVSHRTLMVAYARVGRYKESIEEFRQALISYGYDGLAEDLRRGYARGGYQGALREWLKGVQKQKPDFPFHWVAAYVHTELGDRDAVLAWLPRMKDEPAWSDAAYDDDLFPNLVTLRIEPMWDPLRSDPRFEDLVRRVKFPH
ncbi:MAG TPA: winged helix-turn-helix domain-containing protein [Candidatus Polarisedimenticolia bacterium]|nr:winged helix-turn-helix domain-containing protein [Candidatus Polarisedimenticolia bacterium]